ncbi:MAG: hypothetical protein AB7S41_09000 [Parvibaculaceae bacterium]
MAEVEKIVDHGDGTWSRATMLVDENGDPVEIGAGGGGTEYTEDAAAAANPVGGMMMAVRRDTLSASEVSNDGDNIALKATSKGQLHTYAEAAAGENHIGGVHGHAFDVAVTPTVTNGAYGAGDIVGGLLTFANVARVNDEAVIITGVQVITKAAVTPTLTLILFNADPSSTTKTDNAAYSLNAADAFKVIKGIPITTLGSWTDHGTPNSISVDNLGIVAKPVSGGKDLYGLLIDGTGATLTSTSDIQVRLRGVGA